LQYLSAYQAINVIKIGERKKGVLVWCVLVWGGDVRMVESAELVHRNRDTFAKFLRPLETAGHWRHVLVDRHYSGLDVDDHLFVVESLDVVQLGVEQLHDHLIARLKVLLDDWSLQQRAQDIDQLQTHHYTTLLCANHWLTLSYITTAWPVVAAE